MRVKVTVSTVSPEVGVQASAGMSAITDACTASEASSARPISRLEGLSADATMVPPDPSLRSKRATVPARDRITAGVTAPDITLYQTQWCGYCARVRGALDGLQLDYKVVNVPDEHSKRTLVKELFGVTGIPSMTDGDVKIADDDDAIIEYLERTYG